MELTYRQPNRMPAALLALLVHTLFFALLYFGVGWHSEQPQGMTVDMWDALPAATSASVAEPAPREPEPVEPPKPVIKEVAPAKPEPIKAEIELKDKKKPLEKVTEVKKPVEVAKPVPPKVTETMRAEQAAKAEMERVRAESAQKRAAERAAIDGVVNEYGAKISAKIKRNIVQPPDIPDTARAEFDVVILPGGTVLSVRLTKSSGFSTYDAAVERAIQKAQPLPLPPDPKYFPEFRNTHMCISPIEKVGEKCGS